MRSPRSRVLALLVALVVAVTLASCGDDDDEGGDATTTSSVTTTEPQDAATTSTSASTATTATPTSPADLGDLPAYYDDRASGSGCTPGGGTLPDGWWFVVPPLTFDGAAGTYTFDLACFYGGAIAYEVAESRGDEAANDFYIVNDNPTLRTLPLAEGATARCVDFDLGDVPCDPSEIPDDEVPWTVWLRVVGGEIDRLVEQYTP